MVHPHSRCQSPRYGNSRSNLASKSLENGNPIDVHETTYMWTWNYKWLRDQVKSHTKHIKSKSTWCLFLEQMEKEPRIKKKYLFGIWRVWLKSKKTIRNQPKLVKSKRSKLTRPVFRFTLQEIKTAYIA